VHLKVTDEGFVIEADEPGICVVNEINTMRALQAMIYRWVQENQCWDNAFTGGPVCELKKHDDGNHEASVLNSTTHVRRTVRWFTTHNMNGESLTE
jgi:hypothetical protein